MKMLPDASRGGADAPPTAITPTTSPVHQLSELPKDELEHLAEDLGLDSTTFKSRQHLVAAIHERRQTIAGMDREAMIDVIRWGRRPVMRNATKEQLAAEIVRMRSMRFSGLSQRGLLVLATLRGVLLRGDEPVPVIIKCLKRQEGLFARLNRKRRAVIGSIVGKIVGVDAAESDYQFLPGEQAAAPDAAASAPRQHSIKDDIEESGLFGGLASRVKKSADSYVNQKLDEIESRIDRKLDEIDRRLAEWRDKEIANRIRILKITLWASVIVGVVSLIYSYVKENFMH